MSEYFFSKGESHIVFFSELMEVIAIEANEIDVIKRLIDCEGKPEDNQDFDIKRQRLMHFCHLIAMDAQRCEEASQDWRVVNSLILHISNDCNMKCKYCFAGGGSYNSEPGLMSRETADKAVDFFYTNFHQINEVKFFGGEPLLNLPVIESTCNKITDLFIRKSIAKMPLFKVVTNGTIMNEKMISIINQYDLDITISIDGPEEIHDYTRTMNQGSASYEVVEKNIYRLQQRTNCKQPRYLEVTYNASHEKKEMSVVDTIKFLADRFHVLPEKINLSFVQTEETSEFAIRDAGRKNIEYIGDVKKYIRDKNEYYTHQKLNCLLRNYKNKSKSGKNICMGGISWFSVFYTGDIYPCYMLSDQEVFRLGNITEEKTHFFEEREKYLSYNRFERNGCKDCFAKNLCSGCLGNNFFATGNPLNFSEMDCCVKREYYQEILWGIADQIFMFR